MIGCGSSRFLPLQPASSTRNPRRSAGRGTSPLTRDERPSLDSFLPRGLLFLDVPGDSGPCLVRLPQPRLQVGSGGCVALPLRGRLAVERLDTEPCLVLRTRSAPPPLPATPLPPPPPVGSWRPSITGRAASKPGGTSSAARRPRRRRNGDPRQPGARRRRRGMRKKSVPQAHPLRSWARPGGRWAGTQGFRGGGTRRQR